MSFTVKKTFSISAAHRLLNHRGACHNLHGHNYKIEICIDEDYNSVIFKDSKMVADFSEIKRKICNQIVDKWDHKLLLNKDDDTLRTFAESRGLEHFTFVGDPTAENMCRCIMTIFDSVDQVTIHETDSCSATLKRGDDLC